MGPEHVVPWTSHPGTELVYMSPGPEGIGCFDSPCVGSDGFSILIKTWIKSLI